MESPPGQKARGELQPWNAVPYPAPSLLPSSSLAEPPLPGLLPPAPPFSLSAAPCRRQGCGRVVAL